MISADFVSLACSFWYEFSLAGSQARYGFDFAKREVTFYDEGETKITTSTWPQCGRAVAALLSHIVPAPLAASAVGPGTASAGGADASEPPTAAAAAMPQGPTVPAVVRLVSHKGSSKPFGEVVLAQVLDGCCGVIWALAFSQDGSFLATGGQDGVLRVWQLTASR